MKREQSQSIALNILIFLVSDPDRAEAFLRITGMDADDVRAGASSEQFLAGVVDYLLSDEQLLVTFAAEQEINPEVIRSVRRALPGGQFDF
jgi:hypothetical protein